MKVSIAMATYNGADYILEQLQSIIDQTRQPDEIVITDDCSTDNTVALIESFAEYAPFDVRLLVNNRNLGFVKNFEKAITLCNGDYIALCDQDDIWLPEKIQVLLDNIGENCAIHSDAILINRDGEHFSSSWTEYYRKKINSNMLDYIFGENNITGCTLLFKSCIKDIILPFPQEINYHDAWIAMALCYNGGVSYFDNPLIKYRIHENNVVGENRKIKFENNEFYLNKRLIEFKKYLFILENSNKLKLKYNEIQAIYLIMSRISSRINSYINWAGILLVIKFHKHLFIRSSGFVRFNKLARMIIGDKLFDLKDLVFKKGIK